MIPYELSPSAFADLEAIWDYHIIEVGDLDLAERFNRDFFRAFLKLSRLPAVGHFRSDLAPKPARFFAVHSYLVVYKEWENGIEISRIIHASRDFPNIA